MGLPTVGELRQEERLQEVLARDKVEDCWPCKVTGSVAFMSLGAYSYFSGQAQLKSQEAKILARKPFFGMKSRQSGITGIALTLVGLGVYRLLN